MKSDFEITPDGARIGIAEHQQKIDELRDEESAICSAAEEGEYFDPNRLSDIGKEIIRRQHEQDKLRPYLEVKLPP